MRRIPMPDLVPFLAMLMTAPLAAAADQKAALNQALGAMYRLTGVNPEGQTMATGTTLVLQKNGLTAGSDVTCANEYKDGKITLAGASKGACAGGTVGKFARIPGINLIPGVGGKATTAPGYAPGTRPFAAGENLYVTKIEVKDSINFTLISDPVSNVRYKAEMRFLKAGSLDVAAAEQLVAEVFWIGAATAPAQPVTGAATNPSAATAPAATAFAPIPAPAPPPKGSAFAPIPAPAPPPKGSAFAPIPAPAPPPADAKFAPIPAPAPPPADAKFAPIPPPAPPSDQPGAARSTSSAGPISPGMSIDQVVALLGQPDRIADLGSKKIYSYKTVKVTFIDGKVTPVNDTVVNVTPTVDPLPYEIGLGVVIIGAAAFLYARMRRSAGMLPPPPPPVAMPPVPPPLPYEAAGPPPMNLIKRLDELEQLMELGVLTRDEFETEKDKLRNAT